MPDELPAASSKPRRVRHAAIGLGALAAVLLGTWTAHRWQNGLPQRLRRESQQAAAAGRWRDAGDLSSRLTDLDPHDSDAWLLRARAAQRQGDVAGAAALLLEMPVENPARLPALRGLVDQELGPLNAPREAEKTLRRMLERDPRSAYAHQRLIFYYAITVQRHDLVQQARRAMELECEPIEAYVYLFFADSPHFSNGPELNRRWLSGDSNAELFRVADAMHTAAALKGGVLRDEREVVLRIRRMADERDRMLDGLLERYPHNLELLAWHLERAIEQGDVDRTVELLSSLPAGADDDNRFHRFAGWALEQLGRPDEALAGYTEALRLMPLDWSTRHLLAGLCRQQQKFDEVERLEKLVETAGELSRALSAAPDARSVPAAQLARLLDYAAQCGDALYAKSLRRQLDRQFDPTAGPGKGDR